MELAQIIKWVDDTNIHLENLTEDARKFCEDVGYILEYKQYIYAITGHFLKMDKSNKEAFTRRLFRNMDAFIFEMRNKKTDYIEGFPLPEEWETLPEGMKPCIADSIPLPEEWVECIAYEIIDDNIITFHIGNALFADLLKVYCEVIRLCLESDINPEELAHQYHRNIINDLAEFLRAGKRKEADESDNQPAKYQSMSRKDRIVAVRLLLEKVGVGVNTIDKTKLASFIEAVTGGNTAIAPKNTYAYRNYNTKDESKAIELLRTIGIEVE